MVGQGQQPLEYVGIGHVAVKHRGNAARAGFTEQRRGTFDPARIGQHGGCAGDRFERKPIRSFREQATEVDDLPLTRAIDDDSGDGGAAIGKQPEIIDIDAFGNKGRAHLRARGIIACPAPERDGSAELCHRD
ncbi:hypothetical protein ACVW1A_005706 [Bradyrhizobium sp. LB1.3]